MPVSKHRLATLTSHILTPSLVAKLRQVAFKFLQCIGAVYFNILLLFSSDKFQKRAKFGYIPTVYAFIIHLQC